MDNVFAIRRAVFIHEQGVDEAEEVDGLDPLSSHYLVWFDGEPVATLRLRRIGNVCKIERMAVSRSFRRRGIGRALLDHVLADFRYEPSRAAVILHAQEHAIAFYEKAGFKAEGETFDEAGIRHRRMLRPA